jgi:diadenosine tetraphosphate (Ap4A) HIT family hydrolase
MDSPYADPKGGTLCLPETQAAYKAYRNDPVQARACGLCEERQHTEFVHWRIIENRFPYDLFAKTHDMLVSKRHVSTEELSEEEKREFEEIKDTYVQEHYEIMIESVRRQRSLPSHAHLHLIVVKQ